MSAHEQMRAMLDQLMGTGRDGENNKFQVHFTDPRVCKSFLLSCCPHDILAATVSAHQSVVQNYDAVTNSPCVALVRQ